MPEIILENINKRYGGTKVDAIENLNLVIPQGEFMCLLGPSGCGKTTTLRMIAGLENPTGGTISIGGKIVDSPMNGVFVPPEKRNLGLVFQNYALWPHLTVRENVEFGLKINKENAKARAEASNRVMETLGIERFHQRYPSELSGGQQQRVALARMLAVNPDILLLDEPLSNLDSKLRLEMRSELKRIHDEFKTTIVFVTHDQWEAMTLSTSIAVMSEGKLQQIGTPEEIYDYPANRFVAEFIGNPPINLFEKNNEADSTIFTILADAIQLDEPNQEIQTLGIRPESIKIQDAVGSDSSDTLKITSRVTGILPTGGSWIIEVMIGLSTSFVLTMKRPHFHLDDELELSINTADVRVFGADGSILNHK